VGLFCMLGAAPGDARSQLIDYLDSIAQARLETRVQAIARIHTRAEADRRRARVRATVLQLIGGLPDRRGAVVVKRFGTLAGDGFRVEKIAYESLPGLWVTADVYVPAAGAGPFPAIVITPGHGPGKLEDWSWGGNFARNGIVALAYDPIGQGERLQYFDPETKKSKVGHATGEHGEANIPPMLIGDDIARYMVNDAMRAVDYLSEREDVDGGRIGAFGCSGGGTITAYFAALDDRVKVAASACYITSFQELLASPTGVQDAEQSIPHFIEQGLDFADWVDAFAPKPYAIVSTTDDMFPFAGARQTYEEAKRFWELYDAADRIQWITGPGGHAHLGPIAPAILGFFTRNLKGSSIAPSYAPMRLEHPGDLQCTPTGQVSTSLSSETIDSINRKLAAIVMAPERIFTDRAELARLRARLRREIRTLTGAEVRPGDAPPVVEVQAASQRSGYRLETIALHSDPGTEAPGFLAIPGGGGSKAATLILDAQPGPLLAASGEVERLARSGRIVMVLEPRPTPPGRESVKSPFLGIYNLLSLRAFLVGKSLVGLRVDDAIRAMNWLCSRGDVDQAEIAASGNGPLGVVLLHAAVLDSRIGSLAIANALASYRMIIDQPLDRDASEVVVPGVLRKYDLGDLMMAVYPRPVTVVNPADALGDEVSEAQYRRDLEYVFRSEAKLGGERVLLAPRETGSR
jgi:cephalosporin-C deacetylase-like acetyl esterase